jgi:glycosyltransferase involved in cell wall biosynthesis
MKVAIIADWLTSRGGAEEVIIDILKVYPDADIYTSTYNPRLFPEFKNTKVTTSFLQKIPFLKHKHQLLISLMPIAFESFDLSKYDVVISSSVACSKGVITKPETLHVSYCHTPMRFAWNECHTYIKNFPLPSILKKLATKQIHKIRMWDFLASQRVDQFIANSENVQKRIKKYYKADSQVIHPGVKMPPSITYKKTETQDYYLALGRIISYKKFDLIVKAFNINKKNLVVIGDGNMLKKLKSINTNPNTKFLGFVSHKTKNKYLANAKALIFPQDEDFGITPLEAQILGTPVIAFNKGGAKETVNKSTGLFFNEQTESSLNEALTKFEKINFNKTQIKKHATTFCNTNFQKKFKQSIQKLYANHKKTMA